MFVNQVIDCVEASVEQRLNALNVEKAAECIATRAHRLATEVKYESPFEINGRPSNYGHKGGKMDDITVIVSEINLTN
jgi:hypothetical protein